MRDPEILPSQSHIIPFGSVTLHFLHKTNTQSSYIAYTYIYIYIDLLIFFRF